MEEGDPLTDIVNLDECSVRGGGYSCGGGSWALRFPPPDKIKFVAVVKGSCWLSFEDEATPLRVKTGDVFVLPAERAYVMGGDLNAPQTDGLKVFSAAIDKIGCGIDAHVRLNRLRAGQSIHPSGLPPSAKLKYRGDRRKAYKWTV